MQGDSVDLVCFGELIWDILPSGRVAGGAPFNIINRATALGLNAHLIGSVGNDELGNEFLDLIRLRGISTGFIQVHNHLPTSKVTVSVDENGEPGYHFLSPVAWDDILLTEENVQLVARSKAFVYSSLALRDERSREVAFALLPHASLKICDVNLRTGQYEPSTIMRMVKAADILRMNEFELSRVAEWHGITSSDIRDQMSALDELYQFKCIISTLGSEGAVGLHQGNWVQQPVFKVNVVDTVGSGDAFLASFIFQYLQNADMEDALRFACAVGAITASKKGGTPDISFRDIEEMLHS